ncbi:MAG TPA: diacylglycerol kinase family protein [Gemmatimonadaceae bacterium]|nr:diacylglycerol kinase family protein [Gemmatimonadaceae bacterium]
MTRDKALLIANQHARLARAPGWRESALGELGKRYETEFVAPRDARDATRSAHEAAAEGYAVVIAAGGDGTINAIAQGLARTRTALGILPLGTANDLAREYGVPARIEVAARRIAERTPRSIDLVEVEGRVFCGVGGLALVSRAALAVTRVKQWSPSSRRVADRLGGHVYRISATLALLRPWSLDDQLRIDYQDAERGERHRFETRASAAFVTNHRTLGGGMVLPVDASAADGILELCYVPARPRHSLMLNFARLSAGAPIPDGVLVRVRATEATIETGREDAFVADGELLATGTRFRVRVLPGALRIIA